MQRAILGTLVLLAAGCAQSPEPYLEVLGEQHAARKEMTAILATIEDEKTMADAKARLDDRFAHFEEIAGKAKKLPEPTAAVKERLGQEVFRMQRGMENLQSEIVRVRGLKLKGSTDFFNHFESYQNLLRIVQP